MGRNTGKWTGISYPWMLILLSSKLTCLMYDQMVMDRLSYPWQLVGWREQNIRNFGQCMKYQLKYVFALVCMPRANTDIILVFDT